MALPDPNVPIQGRRFVILATIVGAVFTVLMALLTYAFAVGWAELHHQPKPVPAPITNEKSPASQTPGSPTDR